MIKTIKNLELKSLCDALVGLRKANVPIKFCISRNLLNIADKVDEYDKDVRDLFFESVKTDENGRPVVLDSLIKKLGGNIPENLPYSAFEYEASFDDFAKKKKELDEREVEIEVYSEKLSRKISVKSFSEDKEIRQELTIEQLLEDPSSPVLSSHLTLFEKFGLLIK